MSYERRMGDGFGSAVEFFLSLSKGLLPKHPISNKMLR
jgi:hypothetical protein